MSFFFISGAKKVTIIEKRVYNQQCHCTATYYIYENYSYGRMTQLGLVTRLLTCRRTMHHQTQATSGVHIRKNYLNFGYIGVLDFRQALFLVYIILRQFRKKYLST